MHKIQGPIVHISIFHVFFMKVFEMNQLNNVITAIF